MLVVIFGQYWIVKELQPNPSSLSKIGFSFDILSLVSIFLSMKFVPGGYSFTKQAICHLGRLRVKRTGADNRIAGLFFGLFTFFQSSLIFLNGWLALIYGLSIVGWICFICSGFSLFTGLIPIDIYEKGHLNAAMMGFLLINFFLIVLWVHTFQINQSDITINLNMSFHLIWMVIYSIGYFKDFRYCGLFQKLWLFTSIFAFNLFLEFFLSRIP